MQAVHPSTSLDHIPIDASTRIGTLISDQVQAVAFAQHVNKS
jgi:hypothetical protein